MQKCLKLLAIALFVFAPLPLAAQEICASTPEGRAATLRAISEITAMARPSLVHKTQGVWPLDEKIREKLQFPPRQQKTPWGTEVSPYMYGQLGQPESKEPKDLSSEEIQNIAEEVKKCYGEYQCVHDKLHPYYKTAFAKLGCHCHIGRCRPTQVRRVDQNETNKTGLQVLVSKGEWCDVPEAALKRDGNKIPPTLLQFDAHVCVAITGCGEMECVIADIGG